MDAALHDPAWGYYPRRSQSAAAATSSPTRSRSRPRYGKWIARCALFASGRRWSRTASWPTPTPSRRRVRRRQRAPRARHPRRGRATAAPAASLNPTAGGRSRRASPTGSTKRPRRCASRQRRLLGARGGRRGGRRAAPRRHAGPGLPRRRQGPGADQRGARRVRRAQGRAVPPDGEARVALVVPRVEAAVRDAVGAALSRAIERGGRRRRADVRLARERRATSIWTAGTWAAVMGALAALPVRGASPLLASRSGSRRRTCPRPPFPSSPPTWPPAPAYATALAAEDSGVVAYVNVHAGRFIRELGVVAARPDSS